MKVIKFLLIAVVAWFLAAFGLGAAAAALQVPDTDPWMWIIRVSALVIATCVAWLVVGAAQAREICRVILPIIGAITNLIYVVCFILGATAVVMLFVRDWAWLYEHLYARLIMPSIGISLFTIVPMTLLLMMFAKTRTLGGLVLYLLSSFFGFTLWLYSLIIAGSHGLGWVIGGILLMGLGVILTAIVASALSGEWLIAESIVVIAALILAARVIGWTVAERQFEKDECAEEPAVGPLSY